MKKLSKLIASVLMICTFSFVFVGCGDDQTASRRTLNMSVNPEITFVVDENDKIVSLQYDNEDAGRIFVDVNFVGQDVDSAVQLFIEYSAISGHVNLSGVNNFVVEVNGSIDVDVENLQNSVKEKAEEVFNKLGLQINVQIEELTLSAQKIALVQTAKALAPEKSQDELEAMTAEQLLELIEAKQKEYDGLVYSQINELQTNFLTAQESVLQTIETARTTLNLVKTQMDALGDFVTPDIRNQYDQAVALFEQKVKLFTDAKIQKIEDLKQSVNAAKSILHDAFKQEVSSNSKTFLAHLEVEKNAGHITQAQYDYYVNLVNLNKASA